ncbi:MAG: hypothetical protein NTY19_16960 [Planctomycetota bacterium]|nr:hypothetical protein [Planctomycetota bacterium]
MNTIRVCVAGLICWAAGSAWLAAAEDATAVPKPKSTLVKMGDAKFQDWLTRWSKNVTNDARNRYCDRELGEEIGWLITPFLDGFYYGYLATEDTKWVERLTEWADAWIKRGVQEPDGYVGWPKPKAAGTLVDQLDDYNADSLLGEAMALRPVVLMSGEILKRPALKAKFGTQAESYLRLAEQIYRKWDQRGAWRETKDGGIISVVLPFGIDTQTGKWTNGYEIRNASGKGFSHPNNKANHVARWLLAMSDVTGKAVYRERAEKWFQVMKSRMKLKPNGMCEIWNYWQPAGDWDYKPDGSPKHWVGVHPNPGYYQIDVTGIVDAYRHGLVFTSADIDHLIATALAEKRYWDALAPFSPDIQRKFEEAHKPDGWSGLSTTPWYLMLQAQLR